MDTFEKRTTIGSGLGTKNSIKQKAFRNSSDAVDLGEIARHPETWEMPAHDLLGRIRNRATANTKCELWRAEHDGHYYPQLEVFAQGERPLRVVGFNVDKQDPKYTTKTDFQDTHNLPIKFIESYNCPRSKQARLRTCVDSVNFDENSGYTSMGTMLYEIARDKVREIEIAQKREVASALPARDPREI